MDVSFLLCNCIVGLLVSLQLYTHQGQSNTAATLTIQHFLMQRSTDILPAHPGQVKCSNKIAERTVRHTGTTYLIWQYSQFFFKCRKKLGKKKQNNGPVFHSKKKSLRTNPTLSNHMLNCCPTLHMSKNKDHRNEKQLCAKAVNV